MATMGKYCKAYPLNRLRKFHQWNEYSENTRKKVIDTDEVEINRELTDDDFLYLQENYVVTDGIFKDENIIFDNITPEWLDFCKNTLLFEVPVYEPVKVEVSGIQDNGDS
ncbi:hypothetical protein IQ247_10810 [Plectonema cf. radiosum LEGE 06105]|uniref:Uncharacterized protein n=1 Tax=Plectonema cf. radiosum LEGE 06105 TaxID=945769 RepID=A0A8J7EZN2_9CYAN|nr:hypothetical protein [Plectonema radiosum]MBE9213156.1 hypothetical protein [Plectonema cf. radiosum LEGE 06105]